MNKTSQELHYTRAIRFIDKLYALVEDGKYNKEEEKNFFVNLALYKNKSPIFLYDLNNFMLACCVGVFGLNKESIEGASRDRNYSFNVHYPPLKSEKIRRPYNEFKTGNIIATGLEEWLSVNSVSNNIASDNNYLFNVRNALMHSEYEHDFYDEDTYTSFLLNLHNSNYTGFEGQLYIPYFAEFAKHYYSNDAFFGLQTDFYFTSLDDEKIKFNKMDLKEQLKEVHLYKLKYENDSILKNMIEKRLIDEKVFQRYMKKYPDNKEEIVMSEENLEKIELLINHYYGDAFYKMKIDDQMRIIIPLYKYMVDPKMVMSNWIMHYYNLTAAAVNYAYANEDFRSIYAAEPSLAILKSYMIMYRLQNPSFKEVDYSLVEDVDYTFLEDDQGVYEKQKNAWLRKNPNMSQSEIDKRYFCEVYRDALAHGKIKVDVVKEDGTVKQKLIFEDIYKGKRRIISIELKELMKFVNSKAFSDSEAKDKNKVNSTRR